MTVTDLRLHQPDRPDVEEIERARDSQLMQALLARDPDGFRQLLRLLFEHIARYPEWCSGAGILLAAPEATPEQWAAVQPSDLTILLESVHPEPRELALELLPYLRSR